VNLVWVAFQAYPLCATCSTSVRVVTEVDRRVPRCGHVADCVINRLTGVRRVLSREEVWAGSGSGDSEAPRVFSRGHFRRACPCSTKFVALPQVLSKSIVLHSSSPFCTSVAQAQLTETTRDHFPRAFFRIIGDHAARAPLYHRRASSASFHTFALVFRPLFLVVKCSSD
jgi:hypothetical protein